MKINRPFLDSNITKVFFSFCFLFIIHFGNAQSTDECLRIYNEGQAHWVEAQKLDDNFIKDVKVFVDNKNQTCEGLVDLIQKVVNTHRKYTEADGRFMTAELEACKLANMSGYVNSAKLKQSKIYDRLKDMEYLYYDMKEEAVRAKCISEDDLPLRVPMPSWF